MPDYSQLERDAQENLLNGIMEILRAEAESEFESIRFFNQGNQPYLLVRAEAAQVARLLDHLLRIAPNAVQFEVMCSGVEGMDFKLTCSLGSTAAPTGAPTKPLFEEV